MTTVLDRDHPWPGPASFRAQDAAFFRGRDNEIKQLLPLVRRARSVVLYGASGLGKTSLINAGIVPRLGADEFFAVPIRISYVRGAPSVAEQIQAEIVRRRGGPGMPAPRADRTAWELLHLRDAPIEGAQPLLIFDQFEELFTIGAGTPRAAELIEELKGLIEGVPPASVRERLEQFPEQARALAFQRHDHRVLISVREDFLYGLESLRTHIPSLIHNRYRIGPLGGAMALDVVLQRPLANAAEANPGAPLVDPEVAELIVCTVASSARDERPLEALEVEPALLSILCMELARRRAPGSPITRELVTGSRTDIIASFYERALDGAPETVRAYIEDELITATGFRTSAVVSEALAAPGFTDEVLSGLVNKRLLRVIERQHGKWLELTHDILTEIGVRSRARRQDRLRAAQARLARAERDRAEQRVRAAQYRRRRVHALIALGGLVVAVAMLVMFYWAERTAYQAEAAMRAAASAQLATEQRAHAAAEDAKRVLRSQFIAAALDGRRYREALAQLAVVVNEQPDAGWARALVGDLLRRRTWPLPVSPVFPDGPFTAVDCNQARTRCAAAYRDGRVLVRGDVALDLATDQRGFASVAMSADGARLVVIPDHAGTVTYWELDDAAGQAPPVGHRVPVEEHWGAVATSADARVLVLSRRDELVVWQLDPRVLRPTVVQRYLGRAPFSVSLDGKWLAYRNDPTTVTVATTAGRAVLTVPVSGIVDHVRIDRDGKLLLVAVDGGTLLRWRVPSGEPLPVIHASSTITQIGLDPVAAGLVLALEGGGLELWKPPWIAPRVLSTSSHGIKDVDYAPDGQWLMAATRDGAVATWSLSGAPLAETVQLDGLAIAAVLPGRGVLGLSLGGASTRWILPAPRPRRQYPVGEPVWEAWFVSEDTFYAQGLDSGLEQTGELAQPERVYRNTLVFSRDRRHAVTMYVESLYLRDRLPSGQAPDDADQLLVADEAEQALFSANGKIVTAVVRGKGMRFDVDTARVVGSPIDDVSRIWPSADGTLVATTGRDVGLTLWHYGSDGSCSKLASIAVPVVASLAFDAASSAVALVLDNQVRIWSLRDRRFIGRSVSHDGPINSVSFSRDGRWLVTAGNDRRARIWEVSTGLPASDWFEHDASVTAAELSPSGRTLLTAAMDGYARIWDFTAGSDASEPERRWLARLAEIVAGMRIAPDTGEPVMIARPFDALEALRGEIERACPGAAAPPACDSAPMQLIRAVLGPRELRPWGSAP